MVAPQGEDLETGDGTRCDGGEEDKTSKKNSEDDVNRSFGVRKAGLSKLRPYVYPDGYKRQDSPVYIIKEYFASLCAQELVADWAFEDFDSVLRGVSPCYAPSDADRNERVGGIIQLDAFYNTKSECGGAVPLIWDPAGLSGRRTPGYSVYRLLASRIDYITRLIDMDWLPKSVRQALATHLDMHLPLAIHMELASNFDDGCMERAVERGSNQRGSGESGYPDGLMPMSEYEYYTPRLGLVFHQGELPDLIMLMPYAGFFGKEQETPFTDRDSQVILAILTKCVYFGCKGRSAGYIMSEQFEACPLFFHCFVRMLMCTLLGGYDQCDFIPGLRARMMIYKWFSVTGYPTLGDMTSFTRGNSELSRLVVQEYILYAVAQIPSLRSYLMESGYHRVVEGYAFECMDMIRKTVAKNVEEIYNSGACTSGSRDWFEGTPHIINSYNPLKLEYAYKPTDCSFAEHVVDKTKSIDGAMFNKRGFMKTEKEATVDSRRAIMRDVINMHGPYGPVSYEWLCEKFKVSMVHIDMLKIAEKLYVTESSTVDVKNVIMAIVNRDYWDYHVIKTFFKEVVDARKLKFFRLPQHMVLSQIEALHRIYKTAPGEELHPNAGVCYICTSCYEFKAMLVEHEGREDGIKTMWSRGVDNVYVDTDSGELMCSKKISKSTKKHKAEDDKKNAKRKEGKRVMPLGFFDENIVNKTTNGAVSANTNANMDVDGYIDGNVDEDSTCRSRRSNRIEKEIADEKNCKSKPVTQVNLLGYMMVIEGSKKIILCPMCASPTTMRWYKYGRFGLTCMCTTSKKSPLHKHHVGELHRHYSPPSYLPKNMSPDQEDEPKAKRQHLKKTHSADGSSRLSTNKESSKVQTGSEGEGGSGDDEIPLKERRNIRQPRAGGPPKKAPDASRHAPSHPTDSSGKSNATPVLNKDGSLRKKRGRKPKNESRHPTKPRGPYHKVSDPQDIAPKKMEKKKKFPMDSSPSPTSPGVKDNFQIPQHREKLEEHKGTKVVDVGGKKAGGCVVEGSGSKTNDSKGKITEDMPKPRSSPLYEEPDAVNTKDDGNKNNRRNRLGSNTVNNNNRNSINNKNENNETNNSNSAKPKRKQRDASTMIPREKVNKKVLTGDPFFYRLDELDTTDESDAEDKTRKKKNHIKSKVERRPPSSIPCSVCNVPQKLSSLAYRQVSITEGSEDVVDAPFCKKHNKSWITAMGSPLTVETIKMAIYQKWRVYTMDDGSKLFTCSSKKRSGVYDSDDSV